MKNHFSTFSSIQIWSRYWCFTALSKHFQAWVQQQTMAMWQLGQRRMGAIHNENNFEQGDGNKHIGVDREG